MKLNTKQLPPTAALATQAIHAGEMHDALGAHISPIYQTSTFTFEDMAQAERIASGQEAGYIYTRRSNPTRDVLERKIAVLEGRNLIRQARAQGDDDFTVSALAFATGMAAVSSAVLALVRAGDHVIGQDVLYGSTEHLLANVLPRYGVTTSTVGGTDMGELGRELEAHPNTTVVYIETPANPTMKIVDIAAVAEVAHTHGAKVVIDNTFATPCLQRPLELGADVIVHSTTKYMCGHGLVLGGVVVSTDAAWVEEQLGTMLRFLGGVPSPFDCWLVNLGLKTLPLRMKQHCANAMAVARFLESHPKVHAVYYPGLESFPGHAVAAKQMDDFGGMMSFDLKGGYEAGVRLMDGVRLCTLAVSLGNVDTLIQHPASLTHRVVPPEVRQRVGITDGLIRLSVGLEDAADIIADLEQALERC